MDRQQPELPIAPSLPAGEGTGEGAGPPEAVRQARPVTIAPADFASMRDSKALAAFIVRRMEQLTRYGHSPVKDLGLPICALPREAYGRVQHALDHIGYGDEHSADRLKLALNNIEVAGALLLAAHDRLTAELKKASNEKPAVAGSDGGLGSGGVGPGPETAVDSQGSLA